MMDLTTAPKGVPFHLQSHVAYADGSVVSKTLIKMLLVMIRGE